jgi:hypothetical protein
MELDYSYKRYKIKMRRTGKFEGKVKPEAEKIEGNVYYFFEGWVIEDGMYAGEIAMCSHDRDKFPFGWISKEDLELVENNKIHF